MSKQRDCPDCEQGKHTNCHGDAWSNDADDWVPCPCADTGHGVTYHVKHVSKPIQFEAKDKWSATLVDPGRGKHMWIIAAMYQVINPAAVYDPGANTQVHLDAENLLTVEGIGCFKCEKDWSPDIERRFCQGIMPTVFVE
jgi:hypothetical protein